MRLNTVWWNCENIICESAHSSHANSKDLADANGMRFYLAWATYFMVTLTDIEKTAE